MLKELSLAVAISAALVAFAFGVSALILWGFA